MERFTKVFIVATFLIAISSCDRRSCTKVVCASYDQCYEGQCLCADGYEGPNCDSVSANKYTGAWTVNENCGSGVPPNVTGYQVYIQPAISPVNYITISNLFNQGVDINVEIYNTTAGNEGDNLFIAAASQGGLSIQNSTGTYTISNGSPEIIINLSYQLGGINYTCQETLTPY